MNHETLSHRLVIPADANHYGTLYAGALLRIALESAYATAYRLAGEASNLVLRRVLSLECNHPVSVGRVVEIRGVPLFLRRAYIIVGLQGTPLDEQQGPWMDALMGFVQVDEKGRPSALPDDLQLEKPDASWDPLVERLSKHMKDE